MPTQGSLFAAPPVKVPPPPLRFRVPLKRREVRHPGGKPDGKGRFFYQKMYAVLDEMPETMRERFNDLTYGTNFDQVELFCKALRLYCSGTAIEHLDFDEARGMLREG